MAAVAKHWALRTLYLIVFVDLFQAMFAAPFIPMLVAGFGGPPSTISSHVAYLSSLAAVGEMVGAPLLGAVSDAFGRRPVFLASTLGSAASAILLCFAGCWQTAAVARFVNGLSGGTVGVAMTYLIDITEEEERPKLMSRMTGMIGAGLSLGPMLGGMLFHEFGIPTACFCAGAVSMLNFLCIHFVLVDSSQVREGSGATSPSPPPPAEDSSLEAGQAAGDATAAAELVEPICQRLSQACRKCVPCTGQTRVRFPCKLWALLASTMFMSPIISVFDTFANLYIADRFYDGDEVSATILFSYCMATIGVCLVIFPLFVYDPFVKWVGFHGSIVVGILTISTGLFANGLATKPWMFLASTGVWVLGFQMMGPAHSLLIGRLAPREALGRAMGLSTTFANISMVAGPTLLTPVFNFDSRILFFILGGSMLIAGTILVYTSLHTPASLPAGGEIAEVQQQEVQESASCDGRVLPLPVLLARQLSRPSRDPLLRIHSEPACPKQLSGAGSAPPMVHWTRTVSAPVRPPSAS